MYISRIRDKDIYLEMTKSFNIILGQEKQWRELLRDYKTDAMWFPHSCAKLSNFLLRF